MTGPPQEAITAEMVAAAHDAEISGGERGRYRRIIAAVWPLIAAAERERIRQGLDAIAELHADTEDARPILADVRGLLTEGDT